MAFLRETVCGLCDVLLQILTTLVRNVDRPITCKIRLKDRMQDTLDLVRVIESTGVRALAVHARRVAGTPPSHFCLSLSLSLSLSLVFCEMFIHM